MKVKNNQPLFVIFFLILSLNSCISSKSFHCINKKLPAFKKVYYSEKHIQDKKSLNQYTKSVIKGGGSSYRLMRYSKAVNSFLAMYLATNKVEHLEKALQLSESIISKAKIASLIKNNPINFRDTYLGWENINPNYEKSRRGAPHLIEVPLYESYLFRYLAQMSYILLTDKSLDSKFRKRGAFLKNFIIKNGWEKWYVRGEIEQDSCYKYLFRSRTHMTSHWGIVALYLEKIDESIKRNKQYRDFLFKFNHQLRDNLEIIDGESYSWNMTWDNSWPYLSNCNSSSEIKKLQDVSHGNHVISYVVTSYELQDKYWSKKDLKYFCNTVKKILFNKKEGKFRIDLNRNNSIFIDNISALSDGFIKLARYDKDLYCLYLKTWFKQTNEIKESLDAQFVAQMLLSEKMLEKL